MSDAIIFIIGSGVFAITTTATLLYGYRWFTYKSIDDGIDVRDGRNTGQARATLSAVRVVPF